MSAAGQRRDQAQRGTHLVVARPELHHVFQTLPGADAHVLAGEARRRRRRRSRPPCWNRRRRRTGCRSPRPGARRWSRRRGSGSRTSTRVDAPAGSVVTTRCAGLPLEPARDDRIGGQRLFGPDRDALGEAAVRRGCGIRCSARLPRDGDLGVVDVVAELALAIQVDVDVLGRRPERERARRRPARCDRRRRPPAAPCGAAARAARSARRRFGRGGRRIGLGRADGRRRTTGGAGGARRASG